MRKIQKLSEWVKESGSDILLQEMPQSLRQRRIEKGLCFYCGLRPPKPTGATCEVCAKRYTSATGARYQYLKSLHKCVRCEIQLSEGRKQTSCESCAAADVKRQVPRGERSPEELSIIHEKDRAYREAHKDRINNSSKEYQRRKALEIKQKK